MFLSNLFKFGLSAGLLIDLYQKIDVEKTVEVVKSADMTCIAAAFIVFMIIIFILFFRWVVFIKALGLEVHLLNVARYHFIGLFGNLFLPSAIGGDVIKIVGLCKDSTQKPKVIASVLLDRLSGFSGMVVIATISFAFGYRLINNMTVLLLIAIMAAVSVLLGIVLFVEKIYAFCCQIFTPFPKLKQNLMRLHYDVVLLKEKKNAAFVGVGLSICSQIILAVVWFLVAKALHQEISLMSLIIFVPLICVAGSFPSIGGLGVREFGAKSLLAMVGVDPGVAVSISLINYLFGVIAGLIGGAIYLKTHSAKEIRRTETDIISVHNV